MTATTAAPAAAPTTDAVVSVEHVSRTYG